MKQYRHISKSLFASEQVARQRLSSQIQFYRDTIRLPSIKTCDTMSNNDHGRKCSNESMTSVLLPSRHSTSASSPREKVQWVGMTPLEWIESLSRSATTQAQESHRGDSPITPDLFGNEGLESETAASPSWTNSQFQSEALFFSQAGRKPETTKCTVVGFHEESVPNATKSSTMLVASCVGVSSLYSGGLLEGAVPLFWDLPPLQPCLLVHRIRCLIITVESRPNFASLKLPYERTRDHFIYSFARIRNNTPPNDEMHLEKLYQEVISKLQALIDLSNKLAIQDEDEDDPHGCASPKLAVGKQDLTKYMTNWLCDNWANPYPDEVTLHNMAHECGSSPPVVGNWLINARTRKWRPAIVKAYDMNRPADLLLEDSINIFSGRSVREIGFFEEMGPPTKRSRNI
jgi:hypothetical protein